MRKGFAFHPGPTCDDGNPCTEDTCTLAEGCTNPPNTEGCEDGNACTEGDTCAASVCTPGEWVNCDDGNLCTDDSCDPEIGCVITPNAIACDDGNPCTEGTVCGQVHAGAEVRWIVRWQSLHEDSARRKRDVWQSRTPFRARTEISVRRAISVGAGNVCREGRKCTDANPCTADTCDPETGCSFPPTAGPRSDGSLCTVGDSCANGECVSGLPLPCQDNDPCTDDLCDAEAGCQHPENKAPCVDGEICTVGDACSEGECISGPLNDCSMEMPAPRSRANSEWDASTTRNRWCVTMENRARRISVILRRAVSMTGFPNAAEMERWKRESSAMMETWSPETNATGNANSRPVRRSVWRKIHNWA